MQKERVYTLEIGDYRLGRGIRLTQPTQIKFDISKSSDNKRTNGNSAVIEIYNLTRDQIHLLESEYLEVKFSVGYAQVGPRLVVEGNVTETSTVKSGNDFVTQIRIGEGYSSLNHEELAAVVAPGKTVRDALEEIRQQMPGVARGAYTGTNLNNPIVYGWRLTGTPREMLQKLAEANNLEYTVSGGVLDVSDENGLHSKNTEMAVILNQNTGLINVPFFTSETGRKPKKDKKRRKGVQFQSLLNTDISPGRMVKLESIFINGYFRVNTARYSGDFRGNDWYVECFCSEVQAEDLV